MGRHGGKGAGSRGLICDIESACPPKYILDTRWLLYGVISQKKNAAERNEVNEQEMNM